MKPETMAAEKAMIRSGYTTDAERKAFDNGYKIGVLHTEDMIQTDIPDTGGKEEDDT